MDFRVIVSPVHLRLWRVVDSAHPQVRIDYADRNDAIDCARGLATDNPPALVEVLAQSGCVVLRERYERRPDGVLTVEAQNAGSVAGDTDLSEERRSAG